MDNNTNMESKEDAQIEEVENAEQNANECNEDGAQGNKKENKDGGKRTYDIVRRPHVFCMTGVEKQYVEKEMIKFIRKYLEVDNKPVPLQGVHKKRGQAFAFLSFESEEQKKEFSDEFASIMLPQIQNKRINLREVTNHRKTDNLSFRQVRSADTMLHEQELKREAMRKAISPEDIEKEMAITIEQRITPYA